MKLLQLHEYLEFLSVGVRGHTLSPFETQHAIREARALWPETGLARWDAHPRPVAYAWISNDGSHVGLHIAADHKDCFVVLVIRMASRALIGHIVLDIGAEYRQAIYICPSAAFEGSAEDAIMRHSLPRLNRHHDAFAVLELGAGTYMQAHQKADGRYELEHQLVTLKCHYRAVGQIEAGDVIAAFASYAFGKKEWATQFRWERVEL